MEWIADPAAWVGLLTLVALEIVLGVDNLIFIAILSDKLPPERRDRARTIGLGFALVMRLALLASISWVMSLTAPLVTLWRLELSWRDLILIAGGLFLLVKATTEIHDRIEQPRRGQAALAQAGFWPIVAQIVVLDAVFSLDSIITAVGMVDQLAVMMAAVVIAVAAMMLASRPLAAFLNARPSLIVLCLGFLLMVGLVLVIDGFGLHIPKGYVYSAIGFSVLIEILNQLGERGRRRRAGGPLSSRQQVADAVLRLLGGVPLPAYAVAEGQIFGADERRMVREVLGLAEQPVTRAMTRRDKLAWVDSLAAAETTLALVRANPHREFPVGRGSLDALEGVVRKEDLLAGRPLREALRPAVTMRDDASLLDTLKRFKLTPIELAVVTGSDGKVKGIVTRTDLLEAIAGELPDQD